MIIDQKIQNVIGYNALLLLLYHGFYYYLKYYLNKKKYIIPQNIQSVQYRIIHIQLF